MKASAKILRNIKTDVKEFCLPSKAVFLLAWGYPLLSYWRGINNHIPLLGNFTDVLEIIFIIIPTVISARYVLKRLQIFDIIFYLICVSVFLFNFIIFPENEVELQNRIFNFLLLVLPYYFIGKTINLSTLIKPFYYISSAIVVVSALYSLTYAQSEYYTGDQSTSDYNMAQAYTILPHVLFVIWFSFQRFSLLNLVIALLGVIMIMSYGTRGPLVCTIVFIGIYILFFTKFKYRLFLNITLIGIGSLLLAFIQPIAIVMQLFLYSIGMSTRIFDKFLSDEISTSNGRDSISDSLWSVMSHDNQYFGHGLLGSYRIVGTYPHNIIIEFLYSFGYIIGTILLGIIAFIIIKAFYCARSKSTKVFITLLICASIIKLLMSSTFLDDSILFMLIGLCAQVTCRQRVAIINQSENSHISSRII